MRRYPLYLTLLTLLGAISPSGAQANRYAAGTDTTSTYTALSAGRTRLWDSTTLAVGQSVDDDTMVVAIPFTFTYFGVGYTSVNVCTNGFVSFTSASTAFSNTALPDASSPNALVAPWWEDLTVTNNGSGTPDEVSWEVVGAPPFRALAIEWRSVSHVSDAAGPNHHFFNFQVRLNEQNLITFSYGISGVNGAPTGMVSATMGIEDQLGANAHQFFSGSPNFTLAQFPVDGTAVIYRDLGPTTYDVQIGTTPFAFLPAGRTVLFDGIGSPADDSFADIPVGFPLALFGMPVTTLRVSTNGYITVPPGSGIEFGNTGLPGSPVEPIIAPWWDDLVVANFGATDEISYFLDTSGPTDRLTVQWASVSKLGDSAANHHFLNFQASFIEGSGVIQFSYGTSGTTGAPGTPLSATAGVENGAVGEEIWFDSPNLLFSDMPASGTRVTLTPANLLCGDCNQDGQVSILDALSGAQHAAGIITLGGVNFSACNVTGTLGGGGTVDILDALNIAQNAAGIIAMLNCAP